MGDKLMAKKFEVTYTTPPDRGASSPDKLPKETMMVEGTERAVVNGLDRFTRGGDHEVIDIKEVK
jgi:hypothetical protein